MPLFRSSAVADFSNRNLDAGVAQAVQQLGRTASTLVGGARLGACVFDLNSSATDPPYGGVNDGADFFVASLAKIGVMYAAYQLRSFLDELAAAYKGPVSGFLPGAQASIIAAVRGQVPSIKLNDRPDLAKIFSVTAAAGGSVTVAFTSTGQSDSELDSLDADESYVSIRSLGFRERLRLMIRWSSNCGASTCIEDLGFQYLNGALRHAGLFTSPPPAGIWVGRHYVCGGDTRRSQAFPVGSALVNQAAPDEVFHVATPRAVARMFRAIADGSLLPEAPLVAEMRSLLDKSGSPRTGSFIYAGLAAAGGMPDPLPRAGMVLSKIGLGAHTTADCALISQSATSRFLHLNYGMVVLGAPNSGGDFPADGRVITLLAPMLQTAVTAPTPVH